MLVRIDARKVQEARARALLSKEQLAQRAGVSASRINKLEARGSSDAPMMVKTASKICEALGLDPRDVVLEVLPGESPPKVSA